MNYKLKPHLSSMFSENIEVNYFVISIVLSVLFLCTEKIKSVSCIWYIIGSICTYLYCYQFVYIFTKILMTFYYNTGMINDGDVYFKTFDSQKLMECDISIGEIEYASECYINIHTFSFCVVTMFLFLMYFLK